MSDVEKHQGAGTTEAEDEAELARMGYKQELQCVFDSMYSPLTDLRAAVAVI